MKKACAFMILVLSIICCTAAVYAGDFSVDGGDLILTPYKNLKNEGQISSDEIVITNNEDAAQNMSFRLGDTGKSNIVLKDESVLQNNCGDEKAAFVHLLNIETGEKYLVYENDENINLGVLMPDESFHFKVCGELNLTAQWQAGDTLKLNFIFSTDLAEKDDEAKDETTVSEESTEAETISETQTEETSESAGSESNENTTASESEDIDVAESTEETSSEVSDADTTVSEDLDSNEPNTDEISSDETEYDKADSDKPSADESGSDATEPGATDSDEIGNDDLSADEPNTDESNLDISDSGTADVNDSNELNDGGNSDLTYEGADVNSDMSNDEQGV